MGVRSPLKKPTSGLQIEVTAPPVEDWLWILLYIPVSLSLHLDLDSRDLSLSLLALTGSLINLWTLPIKFSVYLKDSGVSKKVRRRERESELLMGA